MSPICACIVCKHTWKNLPESGLLGMELVESLNEASSTRSTGEDELRSGGVIWLLIGEVWLPPGMVNLLTSNFWLTPGDLWLPAGVFWLPQGDFW